MSSVFEYGRDDWQGNTTMLATGHNPMQRRRYLDRQRTGLLLYRRKD
jgi:hypothetical protein